MFIESDEVVSMIVEVTEVLVSDTVKAAAHLLVTQLFLQNSLEASLLKVTVIMLDIEIVGGGDNIPVRLM